MSHQEKTTEELVEQAVKAMSDCTEITSKVDITAVTRSDQEDPGIDVNNFTEDDKQREILRFRNLDVRGRQFLVRMYKKPNKLASGIILATKDDQDFHEYIGLVVKLSDVAYTLPRYEGRKWVEVGEWVIIPRAFANVRTYKGRRIAWVTEDDILGACKLEDIRHFSER